MNLPHMTAAVLAAVLVIGGCAGRRGVIAVGGIPNDTAAAISAPPRSPDFPLSMQDDSALIFIRMLENDPLMAGASSLRSRLFTWTIASPRLRGFETATLPIDELQATAYPYKEELLMQYIFAGAAWYMTMRDTATTIVDQQLAAARSLLTAYKNLMVRDNSLHVPFLDDMDDARRHGGLRGFIERKNSHKP